VAFIIALREAGSTGFYKGFQKGVDLWACQNRTNPVAESGIGPEL
jgi:hypothetical protein